MFISYKKGLKKDGQNPTYLYGYGGFDISLSPSFNPANLVWMEMGEFTPCRICVAVASMAKNGMRPG